MLINIEDLLNKLEEKFPNKLPTTTDVDISKLIGNREVIDYIEKYVDYLQAKNEKNK